MFLNKVNCSFIFLLIASQVQASSKLFEPPMPNEQGLKKCKQTLEVNPNFEHEIILDLWRRIFVCCYDLPADLEEAYQDSCLQHKIDNFKNSIFNNFNNPVRKKIKNDYELD